MQEFKNSVQNKEYEIEFFDKHAEKDDYNVFTHEANLKLIDAFARYTALNIGSQVADLGCGSGVFTKLLVDRGFVATGIDISPKLIGIAQAKYPNIHFQIGDAEHLHYENNSLDGVLLSGLVHHFSDPSALASEVYRVLKPGGKFFAFDPNRLNPFMYLYRDISSPFYSNVGVTKNERPILGSVVQEIFTNVGFKTNIGYLSGLSYQFIASKKMSQLLPIYNLIDSVVFKLFFLKKLSPFVLTYGVK